MTAKPPSTSPPSTNPPPVALHPTGVNHLALSTTDTKVQLEFWCDVLGCPLKALFWMHGVPGAIHSFVELAADSYVSLVQHPENPDTIEWGVTHAGFGGSPVAAGTMQHVAFHVDSPEDLLAMRDRIRHRGIQVLGPIDHGLVQSIYFAGPEGLALEVACGDGIDEGAWIDPEVQAVCGISDEEMEAMKAPAVFKAAEAVPQPVLDPAKPSMHVDGDLLERLMGFDDDFVWDRLSEPTPPVANDRSEP